MTQVGERQFVLVVESGQQRGARGQLAPGRHIVGSDIAADMVVAGTGIAPAHFAIECSDGSARLLACTGSLTLDGAGMLAPGQSTACTSAMKFQAGDISFRIELPDAPPPAQRRTLSRRVMSAGSGCLLFCTAVGLVAVAHGAGRVGEIPSRPASLTRTVLRRPHPVVGAVVLASVRARLDAAGLATVAVAASQDGAVEATGTILPDEQPVWHDVLRWFDALYGDHAVLVDAVGISAQAAPLAIQAVWTGAQPYVIDGTGQKLFPGAILRSGWVVESISADRVLIRRDGETLAVRF